MTQPESVSAPDVLERELANAQRAPITTGAAIAAASNGGLHLVGALQLWSAVWLIGLYAYIPWAMIAFGVALLALASRIYGQRIPALIGCIVVATIDAVGMGAWMMLTVDSGFVSLVLILLPMGSIATVVLCGFAYGPCKRTAEARKRAAAAGVDIDLRT
jgi:hypothetical protein